MAVTLSQFLEVADRLAKQRDLIGVAADAANEASGGGDRFVEYVMDTDNYNFTNRLLKECYLVDTYLSRDSAIGLSRGNTFIWFRGILEGISKWASDEDNSLDQFLTDESGQVSEFFNDLWYSYQDTNLLASNVFCEQTLARDGFSLGTAEVEAGPVLTFTDGTRLGIGSGSAGGTGATKNFAPAQFKVVVTLMDATDLDLTCTLTLPDGTSETQDVVVPGSSAVGAEINIATSSDVYIDLTDVAFTVGGDEGTVSDLVTIQHIKAREIAL